MEEKLLEATERLFSSLLTNGLKGKPTEEDFGEHLDALKTQLRVTVGLAEKYLEVSSRIQPQSVDTQTELSVEMCRRLNQLRLEKEAAELACVQQLAEPKLKIPIADVIETYAQTVQKTKDQKQLNKQMKEEIRQGKLNPHHQGESLAHILTDITQL